MTVRTQWLGLSPEELGQQMAQLGQPAYRAKQFFQWLHKGAGFENMKNLPQALKDRLAETGDILVARVDKVLTSKQDGTEKLLFALNDGQAVEGVLMRYKHGPSLCLSTQAGCNMGCAFCASTLKGKARDLTAAEMMAQVLLAQARLDERLGHLVLMGSGEPFDNYDQVTRFLRLVSHPDGLDLSLRHVSLSTCGLTDQIRRFSQEGLPVTLSVSLHAPDDQVRRQIMPVARAYPLVGLMAACRDYIAATGRRMVFEYTLIRGLNDSLAQAEQLSALVKGMLCHINLIPLNPHPHSAYQPTTPQGIRAFEAALVNRGQSVTVRRSLGRDIKGACGQLRHSSLYEETEE